jgi:hypothetical protein
MMQFRFHRRYQNRRLLQQRKHRRRHHRQFRLIRCRRYFLEMEKCWVCFLHHLRCCYFLHRRRQNRRWLLLMCRHLRRHRHH